MNSRANNRTDKYGGTVENRCRFTLEDDASAVVFGGPEFICVKLCPTDVFNDSMVQFDEMQEVYTYLIHELVKCKVGIINLSRRGADPDAGTGDFYDKNPRPEGYPLPRGYDPVLDFGKLVKFPGSSSLLMANPDYTVEEADALIKAGQLDMISFGRPFIYNPVGGNALCYLIRLCSYYIRMSSLVSSMVIPSIRMIVARWFITGQQEPQMRIITTGRQLLGYNSL